MASRPNRRTGAVPVAGGPTPARRSGSRAVEATQAAARPAREPDQPTQASRSRAGAAEVIGTFFLVYAGTATATAALLGQTIGGSPPNSLAIAFAFGLTLTGMIAAFGHTSGAHFNAAVTLGLAVTGRFPWRFVPTYLAAQLLGAVLGAGATWVTFGSRGRDQASLGATVPASGVSDLRAFAIEALVTFLLVTVVIATAGDERVSPVVAPFAIGFTLVVAVLIGGAITGGAVNPDRALGPALLSLSFGSVWVYIAGPLVGGVLGAVVYDRFVSRTATPTTD